MHYYVLPPSNKKINITLDVTHPIITNLNISLSIFIIIGCVVFTRLVYFVMEGV